MKPNCVEDYNKNMGGTDLADQCFQYYSHTHRQKLEMVQKSCFRLLNICIVNASIAGNKNVSNLDFRIGIVHGLLLGWERNATRNLRCYTAIELTGQHHYPGHGLLLGWERNATRNLRCYTAIELTGQHHYPGQNPNGKKRDCIVCSNRQLGMRKQTKMVCKQCTKPMCVVPCFEKYHTT